MDKKNPLLKYDDLKQLLAALQKVVARDVRDPNLKDSTKASSLRDWADMVEDAGGLLEYYKDHGSLDSDKETYEFFSDPEAQQLVGAIEDFIKKSDAFRSALTGLAAKYGARGKFEF